MLPGGVKNAEGVMRAVADVDPDIYVSVMAQYFPTPNVAEHPLLSRRITKEEYEKRWTRFSRRG